MRAPPQNLVGLCISTKFLIPMILCLPRPQSGQFRELRFQDFRSSRNPFLSRCVDGKAKLVKHFGCVVLDCVRRRRTLEIRFWIKSFDQISLDVHYIFVCHNGAGTQAIWVVPAFSIARLQSVSYLPLWILLRMACSCSVVNTARQIQQRSSFSSSRMRLRRFFVFPNPALPR